MGNLIVIIVVAFILFLAIRPIIKHNKNKGSSDYGCYKCSGSSSCKGCNKYFINSSNSFTIFSMRSCISSALLIRLYSLRYNRSKIRW